MKILAVDLGFATGNTQMVLVKHDPLAGLEFQVGQVAHPHQILSNVDAIFRLFEDYGVPDLMVMDGWFSNRYLGNRVEDRFRKDYPAWNLEHGNFLVSYITFSLDQRQQHFNQLQLMTLGNKKMTFGLDFPPLASVMTAALLALKFLDSLQAKGVAVK